MGHGFGDDPQRGKKAHTTPGVLRLGRNMKMTHFLNMSVAVNRAGGGLFALEGIFVNSSSGERSLIPF